MDPCLGSLGPKMGPMFRDFCQKPTHLGGTSPYSVSMAVPPPFSVVSRMKMPPVREYPSSLGRIRYDICNILPVSYAINISKNVFHIFFFEIHNCVRIKMPNIVYCKYIIQYIICNKIFYIEIAIT